MAAAFAAGDNNGRATSMPLEEHFSIKSRPLLIIEASHIFSMPLHVTLGVTEAILRLGIAAVYLHHGPARARAYAKNLALAVRFSVCVPPKPYFGGAFEGRRCKLIARRLSAIIDLFETHHPAADAAAYRLACDTWKELLPVVFRTRASSEDEAAASRAGTARFENGLCAAFPWFMVTPKMHTWCCQAPEFLDLFGSVGRYSEQGRESWHGHFNQNASHHPSDSFLSSCLSYIKPSAVSRAPGNDEYNRGHKRAPSKAGPRARDAKSAQDMRTKTWKSQAGAAGGSASCLLKQREDRCKWASENVAAAATRIRCHWNREQEGPPDTHVPGEDET